MSVAALNKALTINRLPNHETRLSMQQERRSIVGLLRVSAAFSTRRLISAGATTNRDPCGFRPDDERLESAAHGNTKKIADQKQPKDALEEAKGAALRLLSLRSHSRKEIQNKLLERGHDFEPALGAIDRLQEVGLQSDKEFAEAFARSKWRQVKWGPSKIKSELMRRGVGEENCRAALEGVFGTEGLAVRKFLEEEAAEDEQVAWSPDITPESALLQATRRQFQLTSGLSREVRQRRLMGWLQRRGHTWSDISKLMQQVEKEEVEEEKRSGQNN